jgi:hypothetical protein
MKRKAIIAACVLVTMILLISSCAHRTVTEIDGYRFQWMADEGSYIATTTDASILQSFISLDPRISQRIQRASIKINGSDFTAVIEGDIPSSSFKAGMLFTSDFSKKKGETWYSDSTDSLLMASPQNDLVIATNSDYPAAEESVMNAFLPKTIDDSTAAIMASADVALYSRRPSGLPSVPLFSGGFSTAGISEILLWANGESMSIRAEFDTEKLASAFSKLLKLSYIAKLKKAGIKVDLGALKLQFSENGTQVIASGLNITQEEIRTLISSINI